jgi:hypothetical protein
MRLLLVLAAFFVVTATADARAFVSVDAAEGVTSHMMNDEHLQLGYDGVPNTGTVSGCKRRNPKVVVCRYTIEKHQMNAPERVCRRKVTVTRKDAHHPADGRVKKYPCELED